MNKKKILSLIMALVMLVGVFSPLTAFADGQPTAHNTTVKIHKILMEKAELDKKDAQGKAVWPKDHNGKKIDNIQDYFGNKAKPINGVAFRIYEEYKGVPTTGAPTGYTLGSDLITQHKLSTNDLVSGKYYKLVKFDSTNKINNDPTQNTQEYILSKTVNGEDGIAEVTLPDGTYRVVEDKTNSTYKGEKGETLTEAKAVPFDLVLPAGLPDGTGNYDDGDNPLHVYPKNVENPVKFDKNFAKKNGLEAITDPNTLKDVGAVMANYNKEKANAKAHIGKEVPYEAKAELPKGAVFKNLDLADSMDKGLKYNADNGVKIKVSKIVTNGNSKTETELNLGLVADTDYKVKTVGNGFSVHFNQTGLDKLNKAAETDDLSITFTYSAKVTAAAIVDKPMDNHATFTYNHEPPKPSSENVTPKNNEIKVTKTWADNNGTAPSDIMVKYVLLDSNSNALADVIFESASKVKGEGEKQTTDLGNGITFVRTGNHAGTFKGLEADKQYKVKEIVYNANNGNNQGYEPTYKEDATTATVSITNTKTPESITPTPPQVTVGGKKFVKTNQDGTKRLAGANFVIQNKNSGSTDENKYLKATGIDGTAYTSAQTAYNNAIKAVNEALAKGEISATNKATIDGVEYESKATALAKVEELRIARDKAFEKNELAYTWVDDIKQATTFTTNDAGQFEVRGIEYGDYRAVETKAPAGFALPTDGGNFTFTVGEGTYTGSGDIDYVLDSTKKDAMQIKNNDVTIPQTGGIGTVLFTVVGIGLMAGAVMAMKKNREEA